MRRARASACPTGSAFNQPVPASRWRAEVLGCDHLRAGVTNPDRYDPELHRTYAEMASHYGTATLAARPRRPNDKAKVEVAVQIAQRWSWRGCATSASFPWRS
ncbi:hypothetical protein BQ8794_240216 [Mesorhizobium prunaredense]|uniref:Transposase n=1 Tax=Mesorhizobium prunaredense TaxID=1631249 RepID=A0A1R3VB42_9HYPH|nr:hypothetical protein BQ8794_240216 [Mesorhizobium prunaredense]